MAGVNVVRLDSLVSSMIHYPRVDGLPLYARIDGQMEDNTGAIAGKTIKWGEASKHTFGSPDNIRRVFITHKGVYVHLYKPTMGGKNQGVIREKQFPTSFDIIYNDLMSSMTSGEKPNYKVTQTGLGALYKPWVCSNIEEIYFDWTIFLSQDVMNIGLGDLLSVYKHGTIGLMTPDPIKILFETACLKGIAKIKDRYPRLRCVGYIEHLDNIYKAVKAKSGMDSLEDMMKPWYANGLVAEAIKNPNSSVAIYNVPNVPKLNSEYSLKDGIYVFDKEILKDYFIGLEARINEYKRGLRDKKMDEKKDELVKRAEEAKSSFEVSINIIYNESGESAAIMAFKIAHLGLPQSEIMRTLNEMSSEGRQKYKGLLGIKE